MTIEEELRKEGIKLTPRIKREIREKIVVLKAVRKATLRGLRKFAKEHRKNGRWDTSENKAFFARKIETVINPYTDRIQRLGGEKKAPEYDLY